MSLITQDRLKRIKDRIHHISVHKRRLKTLEPRSLLKYSFPHHGRYATIITGK